MLNNFICSNVSLRTEMNITRCSNYDGEMNCPFVIFFDEHREILMNQVKMYTHNVQLNQICEYDDNGDCHYDYHHQH